MKAPQAAQFPGESFVMAIGLTNAQVPAGAVTRGVKYRVVSTQDCWIRFNAPAVVLEGLYLPAKVVDYFTFGMSDIDGTDLTVNVIAASPGTIYFTPVKLVPTE